MKAKNVLAIMTASVMMCGLWGCGSGTSDTSATELSVEAVIDASESDADNADNADKTDAADSADSEVTEGAATETSVDLSSMTDDAFAYNGKKISILDDVATTLAALGEPEQKNSGAGDMNYYDYGTHTDTVDEGILFVTYTDNGKESAAQIDFNIQGPETAKGISVGDSKDDVIAAYGEPKEDSGKPILTYEYDGFLLGFVINENDKVSNVNYISTAYKESGK
ncbi:hypothetical protein D6853_01445 [Butyrivibrio sp. X503]|uniref:hypothetical protein n=1 Tax=Butyrivibrio sp. X503 TaxID=2364878 RepID=UPI000EA886A9|nr:hypothetical protein [Butyrivibrio sp. X503]RKM58230.1 hypothetical protein D6853_01445 [Butyrivibrio sp. X503]